MCARNHRPSRNKPNHLIDDEIRVKNKVFDFHSTAELLQSGVICAMQVRRPLDQFNNTTLSVNQSLLRKLRHATPIQNIQNLLQNAPKVIVNRTIKIGGNFVGQFIRVIRNCVKVAQPEAALSISIFRIAKSSVTVRRTIPNMFAFRPKRIPKCFWDKVMFPRPRTTQRHTPSTLSN